MGAIGDDSFMPYGIYGGLTKTIWSSWAQTTSNTTNTVWDSWIGGTASTNRYFPDRRPLQGDWLTVVDEPVVQTAAEIAAADLRHQEALAEARRRRDRAEAALKRAEELLLSYLTSDQQRDYKKNDGFLVCTRSGSRYRIYKSGIAGNIYRLDEKGKVIERLCAHVPHGQVPDPDNYLTQMLLLRHDEEGFRRTANISRYN